MVKKLVRRRPIKKPDQLNQAQGKQNGPGQKGNPQNGSRFQLLEEQQQENPYAANNPTYQAIERVITPKQKEKDIISLDEGDDMVIVENIEEDHVDFRKDQEVNQSPKKSIPRKLQ